MVEKWRTAPIHLTSPITFFFAAINYLPRNLGSFTMTLDVNNGLYQHFVDFLFLRQSHNIYSHINNKMKQYIYKLRTISDINLYWHADSKQQYRVTHSCWSGPQALLYLRNVARFSDLSVDHSVMF